MGEMIPIATTEEKPVEIELFMPLMVPVRDASLGFGLVPRIWPFRNWVQGPQWKLHDAHAFTVNNGGFLHTYTIPRGYVFDKASIPALFWGAGIGYTPDGLCAVAALEHDFLCDLLAGGSAWLKIALGNVLPPCPPPAVIHAHFHEVLLRWMPDRRRKADVMYFGVAAFGPGGRAWPSNWFGQSATTNNNLGGI